MILRSWKDLPENMKTPEVRKYYDSLSRKKGSLAVKRAFDVCASGAMLILMSPVFLIVAFAVKNDSEGPVIYKQERVTRYGEKFRIYKFRSMEEARSAEPQLTIGEDARITRVGKTLRKYRLDELPQLLNVLKGEMSFVGPRPEVPRYVREYTPEMMATLLMRAGVTANASIHYKGESEELEKAEDPVKYYIQKILPGKMKYNLEDIEKFSLARDLMIMIRTVGAVLK